MGRLVVYKGKAPIDNVIVGDRVRLIATVKDHSVYRSVKQTIIKRPTARWAEEHEPRVREAV
jgi:hypothetical protein